jgi:predicted enzyme related to lactoylglutathione lyase
MNAATAKSGRLGITGVGQIWIRAHDIERGTAFYRDVLGLPLLFRAGSMSFFDCGGVRLMLDKASSAEFDHPSSLLYFRVPDLDAAYKQLVDSGVNIVAPPRLIAPMPTYDLWMAAFRDSEGNIMQLMAEKPKKN